MENKIYQPLISIIIPVYNDESFIDRCLYSILNQTYTNLEVIIINDGSTDNSSTICKSYLANDSRVRIYDQTNRGASAARNFGLSLSKGEFVMFVDGDDYIHKQTLEIMYEYIVQGDIDFVEGGLIQIAGTGKEKYSSALGVLDISEENQKQLLDRFFRVNGEKSSYTICGKLLSRKVLNGWSLIEGRTNEDVDGLFQIICKTSKAVCINNPLYYYFVNRNGVTQSKVGNKNFDLLFIWDQLYVKVEKSCPEYVYAWKKNRIRADFTILSRCVISGYEKDDTELRDRLIDLRDELRDNFMSLFNWKLSFPRKVLLFVVCFIYPFGKKALN